MTLEKNIAFVEKKIQEFEKLSMAFEMEVLVEKCTCKRNIKRNNFSAASKSARKCIELTRKSKIYAQTSFRMSSFLNHLNSSMSDKDEEKFADLKYSLNNIVSCLNSMKFDFLELNLEMFENNYCKEESKMEIKTSKDDLGDGTKQEVSALIEASAGKKKKSKKTDTLSQKPAESSKKYDSCLIMFTPVPETEVNNLLQDLSKEVKEEQLAFMYKNSR